MNFNWKRQLLISGIAAMLTGGLAGCGSGEKQNNEDNNRQQNNHSDIDEGMDQNNETGTNQDDQVELDPNDGKGPDNGMDDGEKDN